MHWHADFQIQSEHQWRFRPRAYFFLVICVKFYELFVWVKQYTLASCSESTSLKSRIRWWHFAHHVASLYIRIMYVKCHHWIRLLRGFEFGRYLTLTAITFLHTKFDSELVYQAEHVAPISNKFYIGEAPSDLLLARSNIQATYWYVHIPVYNIYLNMVLCWPLVGIVLSRE
jgi:hypothetical protein